MAMIARISKNSKATSATVRLLALLALLLLPAVVLADDPDSGKALQTIDFQLRWKHQFQFAGAKYNVKKSRQHLQFDTDVMRMLILPNLIEVGHMNSGRWQHMADTFVKAGMIDKEYRLDGFVYEPDPSNELLKLRKAISA